MTVVDASALLAFLSGEEGADLVEEALGSGSRCGAANWSEVAQKVRSRRPSFELASALLASYGMVVEPVTRADAEWAAARWQKGEGLSLADRLCLALGDRKGETILTADTAWGGEGRIRQIR